jgi:hypothetical protein
LGDLSGEVIQAKREVGKGGKEERRKGGGRASMRRSCGVKERAKKQRRRNMIKRVSLATISNSDIGKLK